MYNDVCITRRAKVLGVIGQEMRRCKVSGDPSNTIERLARASVDLPKVTYGSFTVIGS